jgi:hypothetical protein
MTRMLDVLDRIRALEAELEGEFAAAQKQWHFRVDAGRIRFEETVHRRHKALKMSVAQFLRESSIPCMLTAPVIYSLIIPFMLVDAWIWMYQAVCFPIYGIERVRRRDYISFDRKKLAYLNVIEKANCDFCSYVNGLVAYVREVGARTEQYWCPIKHARRTRGPHPHYQLFVDYGDAEGYKRELPVLRESLTKGKDDHE